jgi:hypothetical protein
MADKEPRLPFRWDLSRAEQLGTLPVDTRPEEIPELTECAARVLARSADGDLYFVGRSPDSLHDLLSGVLADTPHLSRLHRLPLSLHGTDSRDPTPDERAQLRADLTASGITPAGLAARDRPLVLVDLVHEGTTFGHLHRELRAWIDEERAAWNVIRRKLRYLGVTARRHTSPNTWRWQQHAEWTRELPASSVGNVSVFGPLWRYLGERQARVEPPFRRARWSDPGVAVPRHDDRTREALSEALSLRAHGLTRRARAQVHRVLTAEPAFRDPWLRTLAHTLRSSGGSR